MMFRSVTIAALVSYASAQSLSSACTTALTNIALNADAAACLSPTSLISLVAGGANSSIVPPINNWLTNLCSAPACSNATLSAVVTNITTGCSSDLSSLGLTSSEIPSVTALIEQYYPAVRQVVCLKDGSTNCITELLTDIQNIDGTLSLTNLVSLSSSTTNLPNNITCSNCVKAAYNVINSAIPSLISGASSSLQSQCGTSFTDGTTPAGIVEAASTSSASGAGTSASKAAALGSVSMMSHGALAGLGASGLVVISTLFTFLA